MKVPIVALSNSAIQKEPETILRNYIMCYLRNVFKETMSTDFQELGIKKFNFFTVNVFEIRDIFEVFPVGSGFDLDSILKEHTTSSQQ